MKFVSFLLWLFKYSLWEEKCRLLFSNISFLCRDIYVYKICKLAKWWRHRLNQIQLKYEESDISANLYRKSLILCSSTLLVVFHNMDLAIWLPWQHTRFQIPPILKAFLANSGIIFWYLPMMLYMRDLASTWMD